MNGIDSVIHLIVQWRFSRMRKHGGTIGEFGGEPLNPLRSTHLNMHVASITID